MPACSSCGHDRAGASYDYTYGWASVEVFAMSTRHRWIDEPRAQGTSFICSECSNRCIVRLRRKHDAWAWFFAISSVWLAVPFFYLLIGRGIAGNKVSVDDFGFIAAIPVFGFIAGMLGTGVASYSRERLPYNLGTYAWELSRPRLLEAGVPAVRQGLPLTGDGIIERKTGPEDLARLSGDAGWERLESLWLWRVAITWLPWAILLYGVAMAFLVVLWRDPSLWKTDAAGALYGIWLLASLLVLFNPLIGFVANRTMRAIRFPRHRWAAWIMSALVALPLTVIGAYHAVADDGVEGVLMIGGSLFLAAIAWIPIKLWLHGVDRPTAPVAPAVVA
jgi:hypothetical protein